MKTLNSLVFALSFAALSVPSFQDQITKVETKVLDAVSVPSGGARSPYGTLKASMPAGGARSPYGCLRAAMPAGGARSPYGCLKASMPAGGARSPYGTLKQPA